LKLISAEKLEDDEYKIGKDMEENNNGLFKALCQNFPGSTKENKENVIRDSRCPGRDSNRPSPE
jgi:hypothetical protein